jgi:hypothetical protein
MMRVLITTPQAVLLIPHSTPEHVRRTEIVQGSLVLHQKWAVSRTFRNRGGSWRLSVHCLQVDKSSEGYNVVAHFLCNIREGCRLL